MSRYIDAEKLIEKINSRSTHLLNEWDTLGVLAVIDETPTADVEEVRHGEWIKNTKVYRDLGISERFDYFCSCCRSEAYSTRHEEEYAYVNKYWRYCPNCGAKMDGGKE